MPRERSRSARIAWRRLNGILLLDKPSGASSNAVLQQVRRLFRAEKGGHTGSLDAATKAVEAVDTGLGRIAAAIRAAGGALFVTADHGNAEMMRDPATGGPHTAHTTNPVPAMLLGGPAGAALADGRLADIAPTLLALLGVKQPAAMTGRSLLRPHEQAAAG